MPEDTKTTPLEERAELLKTAKDIAEKARADGRETLTDDEQGQVREALTKAKELAANVISAEKSSEIVAELESQLDLNLEQRKDGERQAGSGAGGVKSPGELFVESASYKGLLERYPSGIPENTVPQLDPVGLKSLRDIESGLKAAQGDKAVVNVGTGVNGAGNAAPMVVTDNRGMINPLFIQPTVLQLITRGSTTSDTIEFFREIARTNSAAPVAEATATGGSSGTKPESALRFERVSDAVKTIANWIPVTRRALSDVGQIRTIIDAYLLQFLEETLEDEVLNGDGTGEHLDGIRNNAAGTEAWNTDIFVTTRKSLTTIRGLLVNPTGFVLNPADMETIDLSTDDNGRFYGQGPFGFGPRTLWGVPAVESTRQPAGEGLVGDFRQAILYDREQAQVVVGTINDQFVRNMLTLLAELRAALAVQRAVAFRKIDLTA